jgi:hypothetical protein
MNIYLFMNKNVYLVLISLVVVFILLLYFVGNNYFEKFNKKGEILNLRDYENSIDYSCNQDIDCKIKDVHNCCGYYPKCVNENVIVNSDFVKEACEKEGLVSVCGYPTVNYCVCEQSRCVSKSD